MGETWREYELLTRDVMRNLLSAYPESHLQHDVAVNGLGTDHQVDVLWDVPESAGGPCTVVFEVKEYGRRISQEKLMAFKAKVDDIAAVRGKTYGVFVVSSGYQSGAQNYASTYGIVILELRTPAPADLEGRITRIDFALEARAPAGITDWDITAEDPTLEGKTVRVATNHPLILADGRVTTLVDVVMAEVSDGFGRISPTRVVLEFPEPATLEGSTIRIRAVSATVEAESVTEHIRIDMAERLMQVLKATIPGASAFVLDDGQIRGDAEQLESLIRPSD